MTSLTQTVRQSLTLGRESEHLGARERLLERADRLATAASEQALAFTAALLALNIGLATFFIGGGQVLFGDQADFFRELMPATWLSFAELGFVATIAWSIHVRQDTGTGRRRYDNPWALSAIAFGVFALNEITQATMFLSQALDIPPPGPFEDLDSFILTLLVAGFALLLARHVRVFLRHRTALALLAVGALLGATSQTLDSLVSVSGWEFVAEECFKLAAEPFFIGGYLLVLRDVLRSSHAEAESAQPAGPGAV